MATVSELSASLSSMSASISRWTEMLQQMNDILDRMNGVSSASSSSSTASATPTFATTAAPSTTAPSAPAPSSAASVVLFGVPLASTAVSSSSSTTSPKYSAPTTTTPAAPPTPAAPSVTSTASTTVRQTTCPAPTPAVPSTAAASAVASAPALFSTTAAAITVSSPDYFSALTPPRAAAAIFFQLPTPDSLTAKKKIAKKSIRALISLTVDQEASLSTRLRRTSALASIAAGIKRRTASATTACSVDSGQNRSEATHPTTSLPAPLTTTHVWSPPSMTPATAATTPMGCLRQARPRRARLRRLPLRRLRRPPCHARGVPTGSLRRARPRRARLRRQRRGSRVPRHRDRPGRARLCLQQRYSGAPRRRAQALPLPVAAKSAHRTAAATPVPAADTGQVMGMAATPMASMMAPPTVTPASSLVSQAPTTSAHDSCSVATLVMPSTISTGAPKVFNELLSQQAASMEDDPRLFMPLRVATMLSVGKLSSVSSSAQWLFDEMPCRYIAYFHPTELVGALLLDCATNVYEHHSEFEGMAKSTSEILWLLTIKIHHILCTDNIQVCRCLCLTINYGSDVPKPAWPPPPINELWFQLYASGVFIGSIIKYMVGLLHCEICLECWKLCWVKKGSVQVDGLNRKDGLVLFQIYQGATLFDSSTSKLHDQWLMTGILQLFLAIFNVQQHCFCISFMLKEAYFPGLLYYSCALAPTRLSTDMIWWLYTKVWQELMGQYLYFRDVVDRLMHIITSVVYLDRIRGRAEYLASMFSKQYLQDIFVLWSCHIDCGLDQIRSLISHSHSSKLFFSISQYVVQMTSIPLKCFGMPSSALWSVRDIGDYKGGQPVKNAALAVQVMLHQLHQTNGFSQVFCINTFQNEASDAMVKCEDCFEIRNRWLELLDDGVVVNGSVLATGEQLWPDNTFIQDGAVFWADISDISIRATNTAGCTFIFDPGGRVVIFGRVEEQLHITILPLQVDIRRYISSVCRLEGKLHFKWKGMSGTGPMDHGLPAGPRIGFQVLPLRQGQEKKGTKARWDRH